MARQKNKENQEKREVYYIVKNTVMEFSLMKLEIVDNMVVTDMLVHKDIPAIVYGKLFQKVKMQEVRKNG